MASSTVSSGLLCCRARPALTLATVLRDMIGAAAAGVEGQRRGMGIGKMVAGRLLRLTPPSARSLSSAHSSTGNSIRRQDMRARAWRRHGLRMGALDRDYSGYTREQRSLGFTSTNAYASLTSVSNSSNVPAPANAARQRPPSTQRSYSTSASPFSSPSPDGPTADLPESTRLAMRLLPSPLTVIHAHANPSSPPHGLLVSSFNTVSLRPAPLISFNLALPSRTYETIKAADGKFSVSALTSARAARWFARGGNKYLANDNHQHQQAVAAKGKSDMDAESLPQSPEEAFGAFLARSRAWRMDCRWLPDKTVFLNEGTNCIIVGEVLDVDFRGPPTSEHERWQEKDRGILVYRDGDVRVVGGKA